MHFQTFMWLLAQYRIIHRQTAHDGSSWNFIIRKILLVFPCNIKERMKVPVRMCVDRCRTSGVVVLSEAPHGHCRRRKYKAAAPLAPVASRSMGAYGAVLRRSGRKRQDSILTFRVEHVF